MKHFVILFTLVAMDLLVEACVHDDQADSALTVQETRFEWVYDLDHVKKSASLVEETKFRLQKCSPVPESDVPRLRYSEKDEPNLKKVSVECRGLKCEVFFEANYAADAKALIKPLFYEHAISFDKEVNKGVTGPTFGYGSGLFRFEDGKSANLGKFRIKDIEGEYTAREFPNLRKGFLFVNEKGLAFAAPLAWSKVEDAKPIKMNLKIKEIRKIGQEDCSHFSDELFLYSPIED